MTDTVLKQLATLPDMDIPALKSLWQDLYDEEIDVHNRDFLIRHLAYRIQEIAYGGLSAETKIRIKKLQKNHAAYSKKKTDLPPPGTKLMREHQGIKHYVTVLEDGFEYQGCKYKSLSLLARIITGTSWSGPKFFGLKQ